MGGCCCSPSKRAELNETSIYYCWSQTLEENESLSSTHGTGSALSTGFLVDANMEMSIPDTYRAPPTPLPYHVDFGCLRTSSGNGDKIGPLIPEPKSQAINDNDLHTSITGEIQKDSSLFDVECLKSSGPTVLTTDEEDCCPICLEEYDLENPKVITTCVHHFHLSCILEWMERSDTCPVCDQEMMFDHSFDD